MKIIWKIYYSTITPNRIDYKFSNNTFFLSQLINLYFNFIDYRIIQRSFITNDQSYLVNKIV